MTTNNNNIFIRNNSTEEKEYCKKYGIINETLVNGIRITGINCKVDFLNHADLRWTFSRGSYGSKTGAVHFLEHLLINSKIKQKASEEGLLINAITNKVETYETLKGVANPNFREYGIWTVLDQINNILRSPIDALENVDQAVESEKKIIKSEIQTRKSNHGYYVGRHFRNVLFAKTNPLSDKDDVVGFDETEIDIININDLRKAENQVLTSKNLMISVFTEGNEDILKSLVEVIKSQYSDYQNRTIKKYKINDKYLCQLNPNLKKIQQYKLDSGLSNGIVTIDFIWIFKIKFCSQEYLALRFLTNILKDELHVYSRKNGWGYKTYVFKDEPSDNLSILCLRIDSKDADKVNEYLNGIREMSANLKYKISMLLLQENKRQTATPISVQDRFYWVTKGILDYEKVINADSVRKATLKLNVKDITVFVDQIISTPPITIITGDLQ